AATRRKRRRTVRAIDVGVGAIEAICATNRVGARASGCRPAIGGIPALTVSRRSARPGFDAVRLLAIGGDVADVDHGYGSARAPCECPNAARAEPRADQRAAIVEVDKVPGAAGRKENRPGVSGGDGCPWLRVDADDRVGAGGSVYRRRRRGLDARYRLGRLSRQQVTQKESRDERGAEEKCFAVYPSAVVKDDGGSG